MNTYSSGTVRTSVPDVNTCHFRTELWEREGREHVYFCHSLEKDRTSLSLLTRYIYAVHLLSAYKTF